MSDTTTAIVAVMAGIVLVLYMMRRRSRMNRED
jgi:hypothetical protein